MSTLFFCLSLVVAHAEMSNVAAAHAVETRRDAMMREIMAICNIYKERLLVEFTSFDI
jgi:hypothetical protein